ncbi:hypothetical protein [Pseudarthrobacter sp. R1]|uniref:hypothetical protein n=1 Tax=Pseudarthrobacter sp. R1 TaxID=2944934 RepID=UPI0035A8C8EC
MKTADGSFHYNYTGQAVVDADHQVIVATELNNIAVDAQQLVPMIERRRQTLGQLPAQWTINARYCSASNLERVRQIEAESAGGTEFFHRDRPAQRRRRDPRGAVSAG